MLGRLTPGLLDGRMTLDRAAAERAVATHVGAKLGLSAPQAARGILSIIDNNMVGAIRVVSVERGHDPRDFVLLPFGGAGPLHATSLARLLGIKTILVPPAPGVLSALGLLVSDLKSEFVRTALQQPPNHDLKAMSAVFAELNARALEWLSAEGVPLPFRVLRWQASLRYLHQGFELTVPWAGESVTPESVAGTLQAFHALHERLYTFRQEDTPVEIVTLRVSAVGRLPRPSRHELPRSGAVADAVIGHQLVDFGSEIIRAPICLRDRLGAGAIIRGPAVISQLDSTTLLFPDQTAEVLPLGALVISNS
jgi:N-methylhydantoinase A